MDAGEGTLADLLKGHRNAAGMTQEELAERAEVSARTISDTERGQRTSIYKDTTRRIAEALGLTGEARSAFERAARGHRGSAVPIAPSLPLAPTKLIGRDTEVARVVDALEGDARLITLTGPGGIGKTRLALEIAHRVEERFAGRVFFVQLGAISDPHLVASEIARAVGVTWAPAELVPAIVERLRDVESLLVLDTFEHLLEAATDVAAVLTGAPTVRIIATSREALRVRGEHEIAVSSLSDVADATALFLERAREVSDLQAQEDEAATITAICRKLDGVPLAIELAAARAKHLPLSVLLEQLEHALDVLTGGARDLPERQRTMRDTVAWSEGLLEDDQRALFRELSVFAGGWTLNAAIAVCSPGERVTAPLSALMDKSLVMRVPDSDEARYRMLDVIREFAAEARGDSRDIVSRHGAFFLTFATAAESALGSSSQERWFRRLAADQDNLRIALAAAVAVEDAETALRFCGALWQFWRARGDVAEGRDWLRRSLALTGGTIGTRARALWGAAWLAYHQDDFEQASAYGRDLDVLAADTVDPVVRRNALTIPGIVAMARGRYNDARDLFERAADTLRPIGQNWLFATSLLNLGSAWVRVDPARARGVLEQARDLYERLGDRAFAARASIQIAFVSMAEKNFAEAATLVGEGLQAFSESEDPWGTAESLEAMSGVLAARGRTEETAVLAGAARTIRSTIAVRPHPFDAAWIGPYIEKARASADPVVWQEWLEDGASADLDRVINIALRNSPSRSKQR